MCKHCKNKKKIKQLEAEVADLKAKVESHMLHPYPYPYNFYTYPCYTAVSSGTTYSTLTVILWGQQGLALGSLTMLAAVNKEFSR